MTTSLCGNQDCLVCSTQDNLVVWQTKTPLCAVPRPFPTLCDPTLCLSCSFTLVAPPISSYCPPCLVLYSLTPIRLTADRPIAPVVPLLDSLLRIPYKYPSQHLATHTSHPCHPSTEDFSQRKKTSRIFPNRTGFLTLSYQSCCRYFARIAPQASQPLGGIQELHVMVISVQSMKHFISDPSTTNIRPIQQFATPIQNIYAQKHQAAYSGNSSMNSMNSSHSSNRRDNVIYCRFHANLQGCALPHSDTQCSHPSNLSGVQCTGHSTRQHT